VAGGQQREVPHEVMGAARTGDRHHGGGAVDEAVGEEDTVQVVAEAMGPPRVARVRLPRWLATRRRCGSGVAVNTSRASTPSAAWARAKLPSSA
jgi:hypothetical protein